MDEVKNLRYYRRQLKKLPLQVLGPYVIPNFRYSSKRCAQFYRAQYGGAMLVYNFGTPIWRLGNGVNTWNLLWLSKRLIICTEYTNIYINTFPNPFKSQMAKTYRDNYIFFAKHDHKFMSRTAITLKFKMRWFPNEASCWAENLWTDIKLVPPMPDEDKIFGSSLILDFRISWRQVQTKNTSAVNASVTPTTAPGFPEYLYQPLGATNFRVIAVSDIAMNEFDEKYILISVFWSSF